MILSSRFGDYRARRALRMARRRPSRERATSIAFGRGSSLSFANVVTPWMLPPVREGLELARRAFAAAQETGDLTFGAYARNTSIVFLLVAGGAAGQVEREPRTLAFVQEVPASAWSPT
jgi:hypothetical protein